MGRSSGMGLEGENSQVRRSVVGIVGTGRDDFKGMASVVWMPLACKCDLRGRAELFTMR